MFKSLQQLSVLWLRQSLDAVLLWDISAIKQQFRHSSSGIATARNTQLCHNLKTQLFMSVSLPFNLQCPFTCPAKILMHHSSHLKSYPDHVWCVLPHAFCCFKGFQDAHVFCFDPRQDQQQIALDLDVIGYLQDLSSFHKLLSTNTAMVQIMALCMQP